MGRVSRRWGPCVAMTNSGAAEHAGPWLRNAPLECVDREFGVRDTWSRLSLIRSCATPPCPVLWFHCKVSWLQKGRNRGLAVESQQQYFYSTGFVHLNVVYNYKASKKCKCLYYVWLDYIQHFYPKQGHWHFVIISQIYFSSYIFFEEEVNTF